MNCDVTYEELAALAAGDLDEARAAEIREHTTNCEDCRRRLNDLAGADSALAALKPDLPSGEVILAVRRALSAEIRGAPTREIMTLDEVAGFLRMTPDEMAEVAEDLPAFELAGRVRVRRERLVEWIQLRERDYARRVAASWAARVTSGELTEGVV